MMSEPPCCLYVCVPAAQLPPGARVGTSSMRRRAQVLAAYPHLQVVPLRGSVHSRMTALNEGKVEATILAAAGGGQGVMKQATGPVTDLQDTHGV
jgi:porphobilinogen deaminase